MLMVTTVATVVVRPGHWTGGQTDLVLNPGPPGRQDGTSLASVFPSLTCMHERAEAHAVRVTASSVTLM